MSGELVTRAKHRAFAGEVGFYSHASTEIGGEMRFAAYVPPQAAERPVPVLTYLAGLTCTEETFIIKAGARRSAMGIFGHSMGGHGALVAALRNPGLYRSVSAFAPIAAPSQCPWGQKAFSRYLGPDRSSWAQWDATALVEGGALCPDLLIDQGEADPFLERELHPHLLEAACKAAGQPLTLRRHAGYDHGYYFISTFIADHIRHHAGVLNR
jgi:S-formylglutathione hydrolase FrmB